MRTHTLTDAYLRSFNLLKPSYMNLVCLPHALCVLLSMHSFKHMLVGCVHVQVCSHIRLRVQTFTNPLGAKPETRNHTYGSFSLRDSQQSYSQSPEPQVQKSLKSNHRLPKPPNALQAKLRRDPTTRPNRRRIFGVWGLDGFRVSSSPSSTINFNGLEFRV